MAGEATVFKEGDHKVIFEFADSETGEPIDFSGAFIKTELHDLRGRKCFEASTDDGGVSICGACSFLLVLPESLPPGRFQWNVYRFKDEAVSLFTGELAVSDGVARL